MQMKKLTRVSKTYLIADARERAVIPFIETEFQEHAFVVKQVTTADYLICRQRGPGEGPAVLAAIERKTHEDFAASFKDGRHENIAKLRALREATGCHLYYFIEGAAFPSPNRRFGRIPFSNILAAITKMMVRDGIFVVQTADEGHSAKRLADFLRAFDSDPPYASERAGAMGGNCADATGGNYAGEDAGAAPFTVPDILMARTEETDDEAAVSVWARLRGISVVLGKILTREFSVAELAGQSVSPDRIRALKTATGRPINKDAVASLLAVRAGAAEPATKLVSGLRNITPAVATLILEAAGGLSRLCVQPAADLAAVKLPQKTRTVQLGNARASRIQRILNYRARPEAPRAGPPETPSPPEALLSLPDSEIEAFLMEIC